MFSIWGNRRTTNAQDDDDHDDDDDIYRSRINWLIVN